MKYVFITLFFPFALAAQNQNYTVLADTNAARILQIDQISLDAALTFLPNKGQINGHVKIGFYGISDALDSLWIDGPGIVVDSVKIDGKALKTKTFADGFAIFTNEKLARDKKYILEIGYHATPQKGMFFVGWEDKTNRARTQIWTQGQGIDNRHWLPHVDAQNDKLITALTVTFDSSYAVISNGVLQDVSTNNGLKTWRYAMQKPHSSYLMMLAIGDYRYFEEKSITGVPLSNYYYPDWEYRNLYTYYMSTHIFNFLEDEIGVPFPWQNYKQVPVMNFMHGAMENTSATIFGDFFCVDSISFNDRNYVGVNAHELAHQWFGDLVTAPYSAHHWLQEGFASYYAWLAEKEVFGTEKFAVLRQQSIDKIAGAEARDMYPLAHGQAGTERFYDKGAWVLVMLRQQVGDDAWHKAIKNYLAKYANGLAETADLQTVFEEASGQDLDWFFDQWVYKPQIPNVGVKLEINKKTANILFSQNLMEGQKPYQLAVELVVVTNKNKYVETVKMIGQEANFSFSLKKGEKIEAIIPDPNINLLAQWTIQLDPALLKNALTYPQYAQLNNAIAIINTPKTASNFAEDFMAANTLSRIAFAKMLAKKCEDELPLEEGEIAFLANEKETTVILAFLNNSFTMDAKLVPVLQTWLDWQSYDVIEKTLVRICIADPKNGRKYLAQTKGIAGTTGHNVENMWLLLSQLFGDTTSFDVLVDLASPSYDFLTRMSALESIAQLKKVTPQLAAHCFAGLLQTNRRLRNANRDFIKAMSGVEDNLRVFQDYLNQNKTNFTDKELATIENLTDLKTTK